MVYPQFTRSILINLLRVWGTQNNGEDWCTKDTHQEQSLTHSAEISVQTKAEGNTWNQAAVNYGLPIVFKPFVISITSVLLSH